MSHDHDTKAIESQQLQKAPVRLGLAPRNIEEGFRLANMMASSELVPKNFRSKPADVLVAIELGIELGLAPMQALQSIAVINGRPSVWGDGFLGLIMASPHYQDHDEYYEVDGQRRDGLTAEDLKKDATCAVCMFVRRGKATPVTRRFTIGQAKKASLFGKEGPWQQYPDRMLAMRARSWAGRDAFPDVLRGLTTVEEAQDIPAEPATVIAMKDVKRLSETTPIAAAMPSSSSADAPDGPETVTYPGVRVLSVQPFEKTGEEWYAVVTFDNEKAGETSSKVAADELTKFIGTEHRLNVAVKAGVIVDFGIAD